MDFESLYEQYARDVYRFALYLSGRPDQADDIAAETFVRAWMAPGPIREGTVKAYLFAIARNLYRADRRQQARVQDLPAAAQAEGPSPERTAAARHDLSRLLVNLQQLPEVDRAVLLMRAEDDMSYEEIAAAVGISAGAAKVKVHRARARLAELDRREEL
jgi:RNA polymerase sigma-70 factor, ECF subfamily